MRPLRPVRVSVVAALAVVVSLAAPVLARVDGGCPRGQGWVPVEAFDDAGAFQLDAILAAFPTIAAAIEDGIYSESDTEAAFDGIDRNGNGWVCSKDVYAHNGMNGKGLNYYTSSVDDNAAP